MDGKAYEISVVVDMREFEVMASGSQAITDAVRLGRRLWRRWDGLYLILSVLG